MCDGLRWPVRIPLLMGPHVPAVLAAVVIDLGVLARFLEKFALVETDRAETMGHEAEILAGLLLRVANE